MAKQNYGSRIRIDLGFTTHPDEVRIGSQVNQDNEVLLEFSGFPPYVLTYT